MSTPRSIPTDAALLSRLAERHEPSLDLLMKRYWEDMYRRAYGFLHNEEEATDCVQDVFITLWNNRDPAAIENLQHYLLQSTRFRAMTTYTKRRKQEETDKRVSMLTDLVLHDTSLDQLFFKELKEKIESVIATFPLQQQQVFRMSREDGMTYKEIAAYLGISVKTVEKKMSLSLVEFRKHFEEGLILLLFFST